MQDEIERFYAEKEISVYGKNVPNPIFSFEEAGFPGERLISCEEQMKESFVFSKKRSSGQQQLPSGRHGNAFKKKKFKVFFYKKMVFEVNSHRQHFLSWLILDQALTL